jgi:hypothetical protein
MSRGRPAPAAAPEDDDDAERKEQLPAVPENADRAISGWLSVQEILSRKKLIDDVMRKVMRKGEHYGPGFPGDKKDNLLKPGADTLLSVFQLVATSDIQVVDLPGGHRDYRVSANIRTMAGALVAVGVGSCSTMEKKHRWRYAKPVCPGCSVESLMPSKYKEGEWYCNPKGGGCSGSFPDAKVVKPAEAMVENADIADVWNTCLKMAKKRALVDGAISATGCSDIFAQDAEDLDKKIDGEERESRHQEQEHGQREAPKPTAAKPSPAAPVQPAATAAAPAAATAAATAKLEADLTAEYGKLQTLGDKNTAAKFWRFWADKAVRLDGIRRANVALKTILDRLGDKAEPMLRDVLLDRGDPDNVLGILADLERAAVPAPTKPSVAPATAAGEDAPPF